MDATQLLEAKRNAGYSAAEMVREGMVVGLGTGSTVFYAMERLGRRIEAGLGITGIPTSYQAAMTARQYGIPLTDLDDHPVIDIAIDGADQVDSRLCLIKGRGAAHMREKCVADAARELVIVVDATKVSDRLSVPVPVEVLPFAYSPVLQRLAALGGMPSLREGVKKDGPVITDNGNFVIDCSFGEIPDPEGLETKINGIPGVICCGLFTSFAQKTRIIVGNGQECRIVSL